MTPPTRYEAGRELDARIAEKVMGATWKRHDGATGDWLAFDHADAMLTQNRPVSLWVLAARTERGVQAWPECRAYSTDIAAAWLVVEKMRADGFMFRINATADDAGVETWAARFWTLDRDDDFCDRYAATAPHAICLAALAAINAEASHG